MDEKENQVDGKLPDVPDPLLEMLKTTFSNEFFPLIKFRKGAIFMSTKEIFHKFQETYQSATYSETEVAYFLFDKGYQLQNIGTLDYKWLLLPVSDISDDF